jgi:hypothetical protein
VSSLAILIPPRDMAMSAASEVAHGELLKNQNITAMADKYR